MNALIKRAMDVSIAGAGLLILAPLVSLIALLVRIDLGRPVLFRQLRPGLHDEPFEMIKFRTMHDYRDAEGRLLPIEYRTSRFGAVLRRTSLDELPELWAILKGDMSLVGPRPLLMEYLGAYTPEQRRRHEVKPGLTGWAQVHGRHSLDWSERFRLDTWYVDHQSPMLDVRILARTLRMVFSGEGAGLGAEPPQSFREMMTVGEPPELDEHRRARI